MKAGDVLVFPDGYSKSACGAFLKCDASGVVFLFEQLGPTLFSVDGLQQLIEDGLCFIRKG